MLCAKSFLVKQAPLYYWIFELNKLTNVLRFIDSAASLLWTQRVLQGRQNKAFVDYPKAGLTRYQLKEGTRVDFYVSNTNLFIKRA